VLKKLIVLFIFTFLTTITVKPQDNTQVSKKNLTWLGSQLIPSPVFFHDGNANDGRIISGLQWNVIPLNFSFNANEYVSPAQFFYINPVRRFTGSIELFAQPQISLASFKYGEMDRFGIATGSRIMIPLKEQGEHLSMSIGGKYTFRKDRLADNNGYWGVEGGIYALFGMVGLQANYNFDNRSRYEIAFYLKFF